MIKENLLVAIRNFWKAKTITLINVLGLSIGISAALVIFLIVQYQFSFDKHHANGERIYRVVSSGDWKGSGVPAPLPHTLKNEGTSIEAVAHFFQSDDWNINVSVPVGDHADHKRYNKQKGIVFADEEYFKVFSHEWRTGSALASLSEPNKFVLSERRLKQYFPDLSADQAMGKTLVFADTLVTTISGIVQDVVGNSDFNNSLVLGASALQIVTLLSRSLVSLVALACLIAFPIAWHFIHHWLQGFAYHIPLQGWVFLASGLGMLLLVWTVLYMKAGKAAMANPVESLRDE